MSMPTGATPPSTSSVAFLVMWPSGPFPAVTATPLSDRRPHKYNPTRSVGTPASGHRCGELGGRLRPQRTVAEFVAFSSNLHGRIPAAGHMSEFEIGDRDLRRFISTSPGVVQKQQQRVIATSLRRILVG